MMQYKHAAFIAFMSAASIYLIGPDVAFGGLITLGFAFISQHVRLRNKK